MKTSLLTCITTAFCLTATAQKIYVQGGVNFANITTSNSVNSEDNKMLTTFNTGLMFRFTPRIFGIETGLSLTGRGARAYTNLPQPNRDIRTSVKSTFTPLYLEVPLNVVVKLPLVSGASFFLHTGPYVAMGVHGKAKVETYRRTGESSTVENKIRFSQEELIFEETEKPSYRFLKKYDYGVNIGGGVHFKKMMIKANYAMGLANINGSKDFFAKKDNNRYRTISLSVGIPLGL